MKRNPRKYVVGYWGQDQVIYGERQFWPTKGYEKYPDYAHRMTLWGAKRAIKKLDKYGNPTIYELVPVDGGKEKA